MKERPILFSAPMVRAILEGRKTQTRRVITPQPPEWIDTLHGNEFRKRAPYVLECPETDAKFGYGFWSEDQYWKSPCGQPGDRLWVKEGWGDPWHHAQPSVFYRATDEESVGWHPDFDGWHPANRMKKELSRITLEITSVRVERVADISEADAEAEGVESPGIERYDHDDSICTRCGGTRLYTSLSLAGAQFDVDCNKCDTYAKRYAFLWDSINAKRGYGWEKNPWVWVIEFRRVDQPAKLTGCTAKVTVGREE